MAVQWVFWYYEFIYNDTYLINLLILNDTIKDVNFYIIKQSNPSFVISWVYEDCVEGLQRCLSDPRTIKLLDQRPQFG